MNAVVIGLLLLSFFERPHWCRLNPEACAQSTPFHGYVTSGTPYLSDGAGFVIEAIAITLLLGHLTLSALAYPLKVRAWLNHNHWQFGNKA